MSTICDEGEGRVGGREGVGGEKEYEGEEKVEEVVAEVSQMEPENNLCILRIFCPYPHSLKMEMEEEEE